MEKKVKVILVGNSGVGKTCLVNRLASDTYIGEHQPTITVAFYSHKVINSGGEQVDLQIWDTAGQEQFLSTTTQFYRGANVALICFDSSDESTKESINTWVNAVKEVQNECIFYLVATKSDLLNGNENEINEFLDQQENDSGIFSNSFLTSAQVGTNVKELFNEIANEKIKVEQKSQIDLGSKSPEEEEENKKKCC